MVRCSGYKRPSLIEGRGAFSSIGGDWRVLITATSGAVTRMRAWADCLGIESLILGERSVADPGCGWSGDK